MVLLIGLVFGHRTNNAFDESDLRFCDAIFFEEDFVGPGSVPALLRNPCVGGTRCVLTDFAKPDEKPKEASLYVTFHVVRLCLRRRRQEQVGLSAGGWFWSASN